MDTESSTTSTTTNGAKNEEATLPQKRFYRQRAHCNPMSDHDLVYPTCPAEQDWSSCYTHAAIDKAAQPVDFVDIGCGYGGLLVSMSRMYPDHLMLGMEIRVKVTDYVTDRIKALRLQNEGEYGNIWCLRMNAMKYLPNFFEKSSLSKMFFLYPDPHFKRVKHKLRIINTQLLAEYAFVLREGGRLYTMTDVKDLHDWMVAKITSFPLFRRLDDDELKDDDCVPLLYSSTEEGQKVTRNDGQKYPAVFVRIADV